MKSKHKKKPRLVRKWEKQIEEEKKLEQIIPEPETLALPKERVAQDFELNYKTAEEYVSLEQPQLREKRVKLQPENPDLNKILNLLGGRIYFDKRDSEDYLYIFSRKRPYPQGRMKLNRSNVYNLLAYCIATIYGERLLKQKRPQIRITKKLHKKIEQILTWIEITYDSRI